jgi:hypothetical protein
MIGVRNNWSYYLPLNCVSLAPCSCVFNSSLGAFKSVSNIAKILEMNMSNEVMKLVNQ